MLEEYAQEVALKKVDQKAREEQIALCKRLSNKVYVLCTSMHVCMHVCLLHVAWNWDTYGP